MLTVQPDGSPVPVAAGLALAGAALSLQGTDRAVSLPGSRGGAGEGETAKAGGADHPASPQHSGANAATPVMLAQ
jgi:hypothetical protein